MADGLVVLAARRRLRSGTDGPDRGTSERRCGRSAVGRDIPGRDPARQRSYSPPLAVWLDLLDVERTWISGVVWLLGSAALLVDDSIESAPELWFIWAWRSWRSGTFDLSSWTIGWGHPASSPAGSRSRPPCLRSCSGPPRRRAGESGSRSSTPGPASTWPSR